MSQVQCRAQNNTQRGRSKIPMLGLLFYREEVGQTELEQYLKVKVIVPSHDKVLLRLVISSTPVGNMSAKHPSSTKANGLCSLLIQYYRVNVTTARQL